VRLPKYRVRRRPSASWIEMFCTTSGFRTHGDRSTRPVGARVSCHLVPGGAGWLRVWRTQDTISPACRTFRKISQPKGSRLSRIAQLETDGSDRASRRAEPGTSLRRISRYFPPLCGGRRQGFKREKPGDIPVQQPVTFNLRLNLHRQKAGARYPALPSCPGRRGCRMTAVSSWRLMDLARCLT
jgi:hypothetical protein